MRKRVESVLKSHGCRARSVKTGAVRLLTESQTGIPFRQSLVQDMLRKAQELNRENSAARLHLCYAEKFSDSKSYDALTCRNTLLMGAEVAPLPAPDQDDAKAVRFDALMYGIELVYLIGQKVTRARNKLLKKVRGITGAANVPVIIAQADLRQTILHKDYLATAGINEFEHIRGDLRNLRKYIPISFTTYETNFTDEVLSMEWHESELENDDLKNHKLYLKPALERGLIVMSMPDKSTSRNRTYLHSVFRKNASLLPEEFYCTEHMIR